MSQVKIEEVLPGAYFSYQGKGYRRLGTPPSSTGVPSAVPAYIWSSKPVTYAPLPFGTLVDKEEEE